MIIDHLFFIQFAYQHFLCIYVIKSIKDALIKSVFTLMRLSEIDPSKREEFFEQIVQQLEPQPESAVTYIAELLRMYTFDTECIMPFLQYFCLQKYLTK